MKRLALPSVLLIAAGALTACGGAPTDASKSEFCDAQTSIFDDMNTDGKELSDKEAVKQLKDWADEMESTGTPKDISDEARKGFELVIKEIKDLPDDAKQSDFEDIEKDLSGKEKDAAEAYNKFVTDECADAIQKKMEESIPDMPDMSDMPSDMPTELSTEMPSDMQSQLDQSEQDVEDQLKELEELMESATANQ